jgi:hypothetical protein
MSIAPVQPPQPYFSPRDSGLIRSYLLGGAALGGGAGLVTSLLNHLGSIKEEGDDAARNTDDDTLYLNLRRRKPGLKAASMAGSLAMAGGTMSALGAYAVVHSLYQKMKKNEVQKRLDAAQQGYIDVLGADKQAGINPAPVDQPGKGMGFTEGLFSVPGASALLLGLTAAGVTNQMLQKTFPVAKPPGRRDPRRVVVRTLPDDKQASFDPEDGEELVYRLLMATKVASLQPFQDLITAIGQGRRDELHHGLLEYGIDTAFDMVKGASTHPLSEACTAVACGIAARDPLLSPSLGLLAAAEFNDHFPSVVKVASALSENNQETLCRCAEIIGAVIRGEACREVADSLDKSAEGPGLGLMMGADLANDFLVSHMVGKKTEGQDDQMNMEGSMTNSETTKKPKTRVLADDPTARQFENQNKDIIDAALGG